MLDFAWFAHWNGQLLTTDENQSGLLDPSGLRDVLLTRRGGSKDSSMQIPEQTKVFFWIQFFIFTHSSQYPTHPNLMVTAALNPHILISLSFSASTRSSRVSPHLLLDHLIRKLLSTHSRNLMDCLCPDVLSFQHILGCLARLPQGSGPVTTRLLPNIWRQLCPIPHSLQQTSTTLPHVLVCPPTLICKLSADSSLPKANLQPFPRLTMVWPSYRASIQPLQCYSIVSCPSTSVQTRSSSALLQPQWETPSPKSAELHPPQQLALGCGLCWVRGNFSAECWGPPLAAPCHCCWAQEHCQPRPWPPPAQSAAGCMPRLMVLQAPPSTSCQDSWPCPIRIQLEQKLKSPFSRETLQYLYHLAQISQAKWKF